MDKIISDELQSMGISPKYPGFYYIKDAVLLCLSDVSYSLNHSQLLYPYIGQKYNKHSRAIERSIRYAIDMTQRKVSSKQFINEMVEKIKYMNENN